MASDLHRLETLWRERRPNLWRLLRPSSTVRYLSDLEHRLRVRLPPSFKRLYLWHDGLKDEHSAVEGFFGWCSLAKALKHKRMLDALETGGHFSDWRPGVWWNLGWIPFLQFNLEDFVCVDLPGTLGAGRGAVFIRRNSSPVRVVLAPSISAWLHAHVEISSIGPASTDDDAWISHFESRKARCIRKAVSPGFPVAVRAVPRS
jgi:cell wall assembly regulator SMI1